MSALFSGPRRSGIYFFAFNAGVGISTSLATALSTVLFPYLSTSGDRVLALKRGLTLAMTAITVVAVAQSLAASSYVSLVFGDKWASVAPLVAILLPDGDPEHAVVGHRPVAALAAAGQSANWFSR